MLSPSQYLTPDRGRGVASLRDGLGPVRGPTQLFGGQRGPGLLRSDLGPEFTSTPGPGTMSGLVTSPEFTGIQSPGGAGLYSPGPVQDLGHGHHHQGGVTWAARAEVALNAPTLWQRCEELKFTLENCPVKELSGIWQNIVDRIFMLGGGRGWGLASVLRTQAPRDYAALQTFLSATGPLLSAANRLLGDPYIRFEFPVSRLSQSVISQISSCSPSLSTFLTARLSPSMTQLSLNAFEYFMFSFSVLIVLPYSPDNRFEQGDSLYPHILENYLTYYLPTDGTTPPSLPFQSPMHSGSPPHPKPQLSPDPVQSSTPARKSLLRHPVSLTSANTSSVTSPAPRASSASSSDQVWRSESLLSIFSTAWLTQFSSQPGSPGSGMTVADLPFPKTDTLKIVRMLIKHLHYFSNSGGPHDVTPLDQLKRATLPGVKLRMYAMFKYVFNYWPHDTSFRIVLETWLSFIQPWRYTDRLMVAKDADPVPINSAKWQVWVAEHVLFFSEILRLLLPRFFRMDLTSSKNAYMLFRISKVFSQPGIAELIRNAESGLERGARSQGMPSLLDSDSLSLDYDRELVLSAAKQCQAELEGHTSKCSPVFGNEFRQTVVELLGAAERAKEAAEEMLRETGETQSEGAGGLASWVQWLMSSMETSDTSGEREELRRTVQHLTGSLAGLGQVFSVTASASPASPSGDSRSPRSPGGQASSPEMVETDRGRVLTPHGRWQVVNGLARPVIRYEGDPDTRPITGREVVWIVRGLHQLSASLNTHYGHSLRSLYSEASVRGQMARLVLASPVNYYTMTKSLSGGPSTRELHHHPARISLRWLGDQMTLAYLLLYTLTMWLLGHSVPGALTLLLMLVTLGVAITALTRQLTQPKPSLMDTSDLIIDSPVSSKDKKSD